MPVIAAAPDAQFQALVRTRYAGDPQAITAIAARILVGRDAPCSPVDSFELLNESARHNDAQAWTYLALMAACGIGRPQCWGDALDALARASDLGYEPASRQMQLLQTLGIRHAADAQAWVNRLDARVLHTTPRFAAHPEFLPQPVCQYLITHAAPRRKRALVFDAQSGKLRTDPMRTNSSAAYSLTDTDVVIQLVRTHIACAASTTLDKLEPMEVLHYAGGETYKLHIDFFHSSRPGYADEMRVRGQRIKTFLVYLNSDYEGGETEFPKLGIKFRGAAGEALTFDSMGADGAGDMNTVHAGLPVARGEKWLLSQWIREKTQPIA